MKGIHIFVLVFFFISCKEQTTHKLSYLYIDNTTNFDVEMSVYDVFNSNNDTLFFKAISIPKNTSLYYDTISVEYRGGEDSRCNGNDSGGCDIYFEDLDYRFQVEFLFDNYKSIVFYKPIFSTLEQCSNTSEKCFIAETKTLKHDRESKIIEIVKETTITIVENQYLMADSL